MLKSGKLYGVILGSWLVLLLATGPSLVAELHRAAAAGAPELALMVACTLFIAWFWLNGMKDIVYTACFHLRKKDVVRTPPVRRASAPAEVVLVYCTCNDFDAESLRESMRQTHPRVRTVILDDSSDPAHRRAVDAFARASGAEVRRRSDRIGFKAGNLNSYLRHASFDYFVILDSDEIIPPNFVERALDYFADTPDAGIVQANHIATRNRNKFMRTFAAGVDAHWPAYQSVKDRYGFLSLLGHGAMVSRACYRDAGGFPHVVAEDLCFSIRARSAGYYTIFAPDIVCEEEYPVDYLAFKKRHAKWTQGNMEFIKRFSGEILRTRMRWFEKLDIVLFTYSLPLTVFFFFYLAINLVALPSLHYAPGYTPWLLAPTGVFLIAPMLNDLITYGRRSRVRDLAHYTVHTMCLYGSMFFTSLRASGKSLFGKSVFLVTPKADQQISFRQAVRANLVDVAWALGLLAISLEFTRSVLPCVLIVGTSLSGTYLALMSNDRHRATQRRDLVGAYPAEPAAAPAAAPELATAA